MNDKSYGYLRFACGARMPKEGELKGPLPDGIRRKKDGWMRFCVYDGQPSQCPGMPQTQWEGKNTHCFMRCPGHIDCLSRCSEEQKKMRRLAGRKVQRHFGPKRPSEEKGPGLYFYVTCHAEWVHASI